MTITAWGRRNFAQFPWRSESEPLFALLGEILLQRTRAEQVVPVYNDIKKRFPTISDLASASSSDILNVIRPLGLAWRAPIIRDLARTVRDHHGGRVPDDPEALRALPGVGQYVAAAFESLHCGRRAVIIDSNVVRLYGRLYGFPVHAETRRARMMRDLADRMTPRRAFRDFNYALLDFTREICTPRPRCKVCPLKRRCVYFKEISLSELRLHAKNP